MNEIKKKKAKRILIQIPEGLKTKVLDFAKELEKNSIEVFISCDPCYGACDLKDREAKQLNCDLLLHIGHADFGLKTEIPVVYQEYFIDFDFIPLLKRNLNRLKDFKNIGLITTIQFTKQLNNVKNFFEKNKKTIFIGKGPNYSGQILGCDASAAKSIENRVDCFLFLGSGKFHPLGIKTNKPVFHLNIEKNKLEKIDSKDNIKRGMLLQKARNCKTFGLLVSTKRGQLKLNKIENIKKILKEKKKNVFLLVMDDITPEKIMGLDIDCLVNCACPRLLDDHRSFKKPILPLEDVKFL